MTTSRSVRGLAALAAGALVWGVGAGPAAADTIRDGQWALKNYRAAEKVWPVSEGAGVVVAVLDTGVDAAHPDLTGQVLPGKDFTGRDANGQNDVIGHGTGMASIIAGHGHGDNAGIMGLAPKARILPVKIGVGNAEHLESGDEKQVGEAIRYAVDNGAKVINMSFGAGTAFDEGYQAAIEYAVQKDVILVTASGNDPTMQLDYPAKFPGVVVASGVTERGELWPKSTTGAEVTLAAPAENIYRANGKKGYSAGDGTSDSAAFVSAIAALVRAEYPDLSAGQVINRMIKTAVKPEGKGPFPNPQFGYGIASPSGALAANPEVDNGPKENPLLKRGGSTSKPSGAASDPAKTPAAGGDSTGSQASGGDSKSGNGMLIAVGGGVVGLIVIVVIVLLVRRSKGGNGGGPGGPGGPGGGPGHGYPPQQPAGYGQPGPGYPQQAPYPQQPPPYPPQQPPGGGNPYQR